MFNRRKLHMALKAAKMTKAKLSEKSGLTRVTINKIMDGEADPKVSTVETIAEALNIEIGYLFDEPPTTSTATASGAGSGATNSGCVSINNYAMPSADACAEINGLSGAAATISQLRKIIKLYEKIYPDLKE